MGVQTNPRLIDRVAVLPFPGIENAYLSISAAVSPKEPPFDGVRLSPTMTFAYVNGRVAAEWEPQYGPIQLWYERAADDHENDRMPHWLWPFGSKSNARWSQMAVDRHALREAFAGGNYEYIFQVLADWASREWEPAEAPREPEDA